jgi:hypothetical protein
MWSCCKLTCNASKKKRRGDYRGDVQRYKNNIITFTLNIYIYKKQFKKNKILYEK